MNQDDDTLYDVRVVRHHIRRGLITHDVHQQHLEQLEDEAELGRRTDTVFTNPYEQRHYTPSGRRGARKSGG